MDYVYCQVMCTVMLIIHCETMGCLSEQRWGIRWIMWPSCCAVHSVCIFINHCRCIWSAYLSNNPYIWPSSECCNSKRGRKQVLGMVNKWITLMLMSYQQNVGQNRNINIANKTILKLAKFWICGNNTNKWKLCSQKLQEQMKLG